MCNLYRMTKATAEIAHLFDGSGPLRDYTASEDEWVLFPPSWIRSFTRLRDLKRELARAELTIPAFQIVGGDQS